MSLESAISSTKSRAVGLWPEQYDLIDAWRGLAALAVCIHHVAAVNIGGPAVIAFFVISGYCVSAAADACIRKGYGLGTFMKRRIRRIYPPYLLSLAFWAATRILKWLSGQGNDLDRSMIDWLQNVTLTQWVSLVFNPMPSAAENKTLFVTAYWSLCYEEQFYLLIGLFMLLAGRFGGNVLSWTVAFLAIGLAWNTCFPTICYGVFIEYWAIFALGALVFYRLCRLRSAGSRFMVDAFLWLLLAATAYMRWFSGHDWSNQAPGAEAGEAVAIRVIYEELAVASLFALVLVYMRPLNQRISSLKLYRPLAWLGLITFSLYLVHQFNLRLAAGVAGRILGILPASLSEAWPGAVHAVNIALQLCVHLIIAGVFWFFCERPFLNKKLPPASGSGVAQGESGAKEPPRTGSGPNERRGEPPPSGVGR